MFFEDNHRYIFLKLSSKKRRRIRTFTFSISSTWILVSELTIEHEHPCPKFHSIRDVISFRKWEQSYVTTHITFQRRISPRVAKSILLIVLIATLPTVDAIAISGFALTTFIITCDVPIQYLWRWRK